MTVNPTTAPAPSLKSIAVSPSTIIGGNAASATITLTSAAPAGGAIVGLRTSSSLATVPPSVTVAAGATSAILAIPTRTTVRNSTVTIFATYAGVTQATSLRVTRK